MVKQVPNALHTTELEWTLRDLDFGPGSGKDLVLAGFLRHTCVTYTAQGAFNFGYRPTGVAEANAPRPFASEAP